MVVYSSTAVKKLWQTELQALLVYTVGKYHMRYTGPLTETVCIELRKLLLFFFQTTPLLTRDFSVFCLCSVDFFSQIHFQQENL